MAEYEVGVIVPYRGSEDRDPLWEYTRNWWEHWIAGSQALDTRAILVESDHSGEMFNRSAARNQAREKLRALGDANMLIIADADTIPNANALHAALDIVITSEDWVLPYGEDRYYNLSREHTAEILAHQADSGEPISDDEWEHKLTATSGCLVMPARAFDRVGGYIEQFTGWGYEDDAMRLALDTVWGRHQRIESYICHLWHPAPEAARFDQPHIVRNRKLVRRVARGRGNKRAMLRALESVRRDI